MVDNEQAFKIVVLNDSSGNKDIALLRHFFEEAIKAKSSTISFAVKHVSYVGGRILPSSSLYELEVAQGESLYFIEQSQHGFLTLVNANALKRETSQDLYSTNCGTYERDDDRKLTGIFLESEKVNDESFDAGGFFFSRQALKELIAERRIFLVGHGGGTSEDQLNKLIGVRPYKVQIPTTKDSY